MNRFTPTRTTIAAGLLLALVTVAAYLPALRAGFIWDDGTFLTDNPLIKAPDGLRRLWFSTEAPDYWPMTSSTLWLEWRLWGAHAAGYHITNLALHISESLLLWSLLRRMAIPGAFLAALLFAVHPVNVASVAWITERKNLMALLFFLVAIRAFVEAEDGRVNSGQPAGRITGTAALAVSLVAFTLGMLSKGSIAPLPLVLGGLIAWRRRLTFGDGLRLAPFFAAAGVLALVNVWFQGHAWTAAIAGIGWLERLQRAGAVPWFYLYKAVAPLRLAFIYPEWHPSAADLVWWFPLLASIGLSIVLWRGRAGWGRKWLFAWGYFVALLLPVMGFTGIGFMRFSVVADHYQHLALIAVVTMAAAEWTRWRAPLASARWSRAADVVTFGIVTGLAILTWRQCHIYRDAETLYRATLALNPRAWLAHNNLGLLDYQRGDRAAARAHFEMALRLNPDCAEAHNNIGMLLADGGNIDAAIDHYRTSLRLNPRYAEAHNNLANALRQSGQPDAALAEYTEALRLQPATAAAENGIGLILAAGGRTDEAIAHYRKALTFDAGFFQAHENLGLALGGAGRLPEAANELAEAVRLQPGSAEAHFDFGLALANLGKLPDSIGQLGAAVRIQPDFAEAHANLGVALAKAGRIAEAIAELQTALRLKPDYAEARDDLRTLQRRGASE